MKILDVLLITAAIFFLSSCLHTQTHKVFDGQKPQICVDVFDKSPSYYEDATKLDKYSVEDLITLNKCGKEYTPQISLNTEIINHQTYPVPVLLEQLKKEENDEFRFYIIDVLGETPEFRLNSYKYNDQFKKDKKIIISGVSEAIAKMKDSDYKTNAAKKLFLIKKYFEENP